MKDRNVAGGRQPTLDTIEHMLAAVADGSLSRDEADRWAARWVAEDHLQWDELSWWALTLLHGIDLRHGPGGDYLHDDHQLIEWLGELRRRRREVRSRIHHIEQATTDQVTVTVR